MSTQDSLQDQLDALISLVSNCSSGNADDDAVEQAVNSLLTNVPPIQSISRPDSKPAADNQTIVEDEDDYDDADTNEIRDTSASAAAAGSASSKMKSRGTAEPATLKSLEEQEARQKEKHESEHFTISEAWKNLEDIPLGRTGAKIMITFGDGPEPIPTACATALLATRQCLQTAIKDARALRRQMKKEYDKAKVAVNLHKAKKKERSILGNGPDAENAGAGGVDMDLYFQAITSTGHDKLSKDNPTGFDDTQLEKLFPEEMYAYKRWNKMHNAYTSSKNDDARSTEEKSAENQVDDDEKDEIKNEATSLHDGVGGHLRDRLSQFDIRTDRMKNQWYMAFSEVRQGSFLSRGGRSSEDRHWEKERKKLPGKRKMNTWEALPSSHIQFLHWVGFDQRSPLPPPDASTTEALAFLGYDFCGKIIEKAIFIKCLEKREELRQSGVKGVTTKDELVLELGRDEQLTKEDIEKALSDSTVVPKPLYNSSNATLQATDAAQIYFGPGFEERIEMEMEQ